MGANNILLPVRDYDLAATLSCGQAFRWQQRAAGILPAGPRPRSAGRMQAARSASWEGVIGARWVRLQAADQGIAAHSASEEDDWRWLTDYLQTGVDLAGVLASFPNDKPMRAAVTACRGLRLLRQEPWECLASFILSSTKQIVQIRQIVAQLCQRFGELVAVPEGHAPEFAFPSAARLAACRESELRECKAGFRAPNLLDAACRVASRELNLERLPDLSMDEARCQLLRLRGVGEKIANCVLLFACGFPSAFPVDVWVRKALRQLYFPKRQPSPQRLRQFTETHFGPHAGYAQQYLFHSFRLTAKNELRN